MKPRWKVRIDKAGQPFTHHSSQDSYLLALEEATIIFAKMNDGNPNDAPRIAIFAVNREEVEGHPA